MSVCLTRVRNAQQQTAIATAPFNTRRRYRTAHNARNDFSSCLQLASANIENVCDHTFRLRRLPRCAMSLLLWYGRTSHAREQLA